MLKCFKAFYCIITINFCIVYITHKMMTLESLHNHYYLLNYSLVQFVNQLCSRDYIKKKTVIGVKNKITNLFKRNTTKKYSKPTPINNVYRGRKKPRTLSEDKILKTIHNKITRDLKNLFQQEEEEYYYKTVRAGNFWSKNYIEYESNGIIK